MKLVVASNNPGKLREFGQMLAPLGWALVFRSAWAVSGRSRRLLWLFGPAGLAALAPLLATAVLYALWYSNGFGS